MITKEHYESLVEQNKIASRKNDYSKMVMVGDTNYNLMKEYEQEFVCKHNSVEELQGGQIEICRNCGKQWGK